MYTESPWPVMEYDDSPSAMLNPSNCVERPFDTDRMVITFFPEVVEKLKAGGQIVQERIIPGENPVPIYRFARDRGALMTLGQVGCPACAGNLDLFHAMGVRRVMFCGGGGVLDGRIGAGRLLLVEGAVRDEGFSYQYAPPSRVMYTDSQITDRIARCLDKQGVPYLRGLTWTTDAMFRETAERVRRRREEGAKIVEMEQAGCIAVARFRGFAYGALIYGGDDLSGESWSDRGWRSREGIRYDLVNLCRALTGEL